MPFLSKFSLAILQDAVDRERHEKTALIAHAAEQGQRIAELEAVNRTLERQNAVHQANTGWLRNHVNTLTDERARLLLRDFNFLTDAPEIVHMPTAATTAARKTAADDAQERADVAVADAVSGAGLFEDMGDEAARELGVEHDPTGAVVYHK